MSFLRVKYIKHIFLIPELYSARFWGW